MYSPGSLNVTLVVALPLNGSGTSLRIIFSTAGRSLLNDTRPGARYAIHRTLTGAAISFGLAPDDDVNFSSSETHTVSDSGSPALAFRSAISGRGPCTVGPCSSKPSTGGMFPTAASTNGEISQSGLRLAGITVVLLFATSVQVSFLSPKSAGTWMVNNPQARPGRKCVG